MDSIDVRREIQEFFKESQILLQPGVHYFDTIKFHVGIAGNILRIPIQKKKKGTFAHFNFEKKK